MAYFGEAYMGRRRQQWLRSLAYVEAQTTINASRLIDTYGEQAAYQQRTINKVAGQGTMIKITIPIYEDTA